MGRLYALATAVLGAAALALQIVGLHVAVPWLFVGALAFAVVAVFLAYVRATNERDLARGVSPARYLVTVTSVVVIVDTDEWGDPCVEISVRLTNSSASVVNIHIDHVNPRRENGSGYLPNFIGVRDFTMTPREDRDLVVARDKYLPRVPGYVLTGTIAIQLTYGVPGGDSYTRSEKKSWSKNLSDGAPAKFEDTAEAIDMPESTFAG